MIDQTVGRLAPSPTGGLHLGHARTFLIAWLSARQAGGRVVLRIEDLDATRARAEAIDSAVADLEWLGLDWDDGPFYQSRRTDLYDNALSRLRDAELVYPCTCTRADILRAASAPHAEDEGPAYPGTCADRSAADAATLGDRPFAWRFRVSGRTEPVAWDDLFLGRISIDPPRLGGDFVVGRQGAGASYQLAVVVDDSQMGVTQVIRGDDLIPSTPRQILLYEALHHAQPQFGHVPLVLGPDGRRLAKRDGSIKLATLRDQGLDPRDLIGLLAHSCGWTDHPAPSSPYHWITRYSPSSIPATPWVLPEMRTNHRGTEAQRRQVEGGGEEEKEKAREG
ncbi:tRNA glutamyl-Q(34) synthetase GluQRS [Aquisphaera insulae]|uniref:tRNA glutamyl-Q(34) synthetase GluQRS n=1 Tax=Aquisphaera insulae TaxID=2712864 RepID=UPI0013E9B658|nr:tRNA glutamyl-Q(34) synthetase GluQRS [Aquisphaera insulae]